jgi:phenylalanyl-tRNA synthetase beta chain
MKVAVEWLRSFGDFNSLSDDHLADKLTMAGLEVEEKHGSGNSAVFVTKVTPNRGDWLSIYGVAREAAAATSLPLHQQIAYTSLPVESSIGAFTVEVVNSDWCPRFAAAVISNVEHKPSPKFIQDRLTLAGMRPLNVIVDITNYVMIELGQPLHAYDQSTLNGNKIVVRPARDGEIIKTLDGADHPLTGEMLVIADAKRPIGIAGIMGGVETEVTPATKTIVLESAHFDASVIRRGAKALGMTTEASYRFERRVDPALVPIALLRAVDLLVKYAGGKPAAHIIDTLSTPIKPNVIKLRVQRVNQILGLPLLASDVKFALLRLGLAVEQDGESLAVSVYSFRPDLKTEIDLIEEVGRMVGYWKLPETVPTRPGGLNEDFATGRFESLLRTILVGQGLVECYSHTLGSVSSFDDPTLAEARVSVRSSISTELAALRLNLLPHLLDALALNLRFGAGAVRLFETGKVFYKTGLEKFAEPRHVAAVLSGGAADYYSVKGIVENLLDALNIRNVSFERSEQFAMHPDRCSSVIADGVTLGYVAELDPYIVEENLELPPASGRIAAFELDAALLQEIYSHLVNQEYIVLPKFPSVSRDIALLFDLDVPFGQIKTVTSETTGELLDEISLLSVYSGERVPKGQKSVAIRLTLRSRTRTLMESDAEAVVSAVKAALTEKLAAKER